MITHFLKYIVTRISIPIIIGRKSEDRQLGQGNSLSIDNSQNIFEYKDFKDTYNFGNFFYVESKEFAGTLSNSYTIQLTLANPLVIQMIRFVLQHDRPQELIFTTPSINVGSNRTCEYIKYKLDESSPWAKKIQSSQMAFGIFAMLKIELVSIKNILTHQTHYLLKFHQMFSFLSDPSVYI
jgi:hypothetical protein